MGQSDSTESTLPPYPDQPDVSPSLLKSTENFLPKKIHSLGNGLHVAVSYDPANVIIIEGKDGLIIVDTGTYYETAKEVLKDFRNISDKCVKAIIYTHSHPDHFGGSGAFAEEACKDSFEIYAHETFMPQLTHEFGAAGSAQAIRGHGVFGFDLPDEGSDRNVGHGKAIRFPAGLTATFVPPTITFAGNSAKYNIAGLDVELYHVKGESPDEIFVWFPEKKAIVPGENIDIAFPNVATIRGSVYRDPMDYVNSLDLMLKLEPEYMLPTHANPASGKENVKEIVTAFRDGTQYIYDQTIRGMNQGKSADELAYSIELPPYLKDHLWLRENRGLIQWHVRGIWHGNLGWFEGDTGFLTPVSLVERSKKIVKGFGGINSAINDARDAMENNEYEWAAELLSYVLYAESDNEEAKLLKAQVLRILAQRTPAADARNWFLTQALMLEGKITLDMSAFPPSDTTHIPVKYIMELIPLSVDPKKAQGVEKLVGVEFSDINESYSIHIRHSIAAIGDSLPDNPDIKLTMDSNVFKKIMARTDTVDTALSSGDATIDVGSSDDLKEFLAVFDRVNVTPSGTG
jgi:alkyl sulfatase BDS1-like metallo-beta-lactamase superfamily hydrolase